MAYNVLYKEIENKEELDKFYKDNAMTFENLDDLTVFTFDDFLKELENNGIIFNKDKIVIHQIPRHRMNDIYRLHDDNRYPDDERYIYVFDADYYDIDTSKLNKVHGMRWFNDIIDNKLYKEYNSYMAESEDKE